MSEDLDKHLISPDGSIRIEFKMTGGDREPEYLNPRVVDAVSGEVLLDLWESAWDAGGTVAEEKKITT